MGATYLEVQELNTELLVTDSPSPEVVEVVTAGPQGPAGLGTLSVTSKTAAYTATLSDSVILADSTSGALVLTLPTAVGNTGVVFFIKKTDASGNAVTITPAGGQTIDGASTFPITVRYQTVTVVSNGINWFII